MACTRFVFPYFLFLFPISALAQSSGTVAVGGILTADESSRPWLSRSGDFAFGFKPFQGKDQFLLSIWYDKIPDKTAVWYVNSINQVPRGSSITLDAQQGLVLRDPQGQVIWRTDDILNQADHAYMNDTGNFILKGSDDAWLWQSFKLPSDTILPSQELVIGKFLNSRKSENSFSGGRFYMRFRDDGNLVLTSQSVPTNTKKDVVYCNSRTSGSLTNSSDSGNRVIFDSRGYLYIQSTNEVKVPISPVSDSGPPASENYYKATLDFDGVFTSYTHPKNFSGNPGWTVLFSIPDNICTGIMAPTGLGVCGFNSICMIQNKRPICECPRGYNLVDPNDNYGGCDRNFTLTCSETEQRLAPDLYDFEVRTDVDWPLSDFEQIDPADEALCRQSCLHDCFCSVAIYRSNSCWKKKLPLSNGKVDNSLNSKALIKYRKSDAPSLNPSFPGGSKPKDRKTLILVGSMLLGGSLFLNLVLIGKACLGCYLIYQKKKAGIIQSSTASVETNLRCFTFKELTEATDGFKEELGSGSFGVVYRGRLAMSSGNFTVAVKKLHRMAQEKEFRAEVNSIGQTNHKNLVRLLGFCDEGQHRVLVYEYMGNGTLATFIFSDHKPSWTLRKQIATGIARGLEYLHEECTTQIIHCDIKPQNILLDDCYNARISDFGLAKFLDINQSRASLTHVRGTRGYVAPEWFRNKQITAKVDVYSFGVLLLEIISCEKCTDQIKIDEENYSVLLTDLAWDCFQENKLDTFVKNDFVALHDKRMLETFVKVGIWCIQENSSLRPTMRMVSQMLEGILEVQNPPCPYPFSSTD